MNWSISNLSGPREKVVLAVNLSDSVPAEAKAWLVALVRSLPAQFNGARIDAHCQLAGDSTHVHATVRPLRLAL